MQAMKTLVSGIEQNLMQAQGKSREFDGLKAMVKQVSMTGSQYQVDVEMSAPQDSPFTKTFSASSGLEVWLWQESTETRWHTVSFEMRDLAAP